jgi:Rrf2 family protein
VNFNTRTRYAIRSMLEIALDEENNGVYQKDIADNQGISYKYLDQIIPALKTAGLISNVKGKKSGYILTRDKSLISMFDIHRAVGTESCVVDCLEHKVLCEREDGCAVKQFWSGLNDHIISYLKGISLKNLVDNHKKINLAESITIA